MNLFSPKTLFWICVRIGLALLFLRLLLLVSENTRSQFAVIIFLIIGTLVFLLKIFFFAAIRLAENQT